MTRTIVFVCLALAACGPDAGAPPVVHQVIADSADLAPAVDYALEWWGERGEALERVATCDGVAPCTVVRWAVPGELGPRDRGWTNGAPDGGTMTRIAAGPIGDALGVIVSHELGHAQGRGHVTDTRELMYTYADPGGELCIDAEACRFGGAR